MSTHVRSQEEIAARVKALESILIEKGIMTTAAVDRLVEIYENEVGPQLGAKVVARAWTDPVFKQRLLADATKACADFGAGHPAERQPPARPPRACRGRPAGALTQVCEPRAARAFAIIPELTAVTLSDSPASRVASSTRSSRSGVASPLSKRCWASLAAISASCRARCTPIVVGSVLLISLLARSAAHVRRERRDH